MTRYSSPECSNIRPDYLHRHQPRHQRQLLQSQQGVGYPMDSRSLLRELIQFSSKPVFLRLLQMLIVPATASSLYMDLMDIVRGLGRRQTGPIGYVTSFHQTCHMHEFSPGVMMRIRIALPKSVLNISTTMLEP